MPKNTRGRSSFIAFLEELMGSRGLGSTQLSRELGLTRSVVGHWLSGEDIPTLGSCHKLAAYTGVPLERILRLCGHLPDAPVTASDALPDFGEYAHARYPGVFDDGAITTIEQLIDLRRQRIVGEGRTQGLPRRPRQRIPSLHADTRGGSPFVDFLRQLMRSRGLLPSHLARDLGMSHTTVVRWLSGETTVSLSSCGRLSEYADVPLHHILSLCSDLPCATGVPVGSLPSFNEYTRKKHPDVFDDDVTAMIEKLIELWQQDRPDSRCRWERTTATAIDETSLVYWAGLLDGQGHIGLSYTRPSEQNPRGRYSLRVEVNQQTKDPGEFFGELLGAFGGKVIAVNTSTASYGWHIGGEGAKRFLAAVVRYLRVKKRQAELAIGLQSLMRRRGGRVGALLATDDILATDEMVKQRHPVLQGPRVRRERRAGQHAYGTV